MANRAWCTDYSCPDYCPHCGNGHGVCGGGGQWGDQSDMLKYLDGPQTTFAPGEVVEFEIKITAHHMGHFEFGLCREQLSPDTAELRCFEFSRVIVFRFSFYRSSRKGSLIMFGRFLVGAGSGPAALELAFSSQLFSFAFRRKVLAWRPAYDPNRLW